MRTSTQIARRRLRASRSGFSILEIAVGTAFLMIGLLVVTSSVLALQNMRRVDEESRIVGETLRSLMHEIHEVAEVSVGTPGGWAPSVLAACAPGGTMGQVFDVPGLDPWPEERTVGRLEVLTDETVTDAELGVELGLPLDLDRDGRIGNPDVGEGAVLLPVVLRARWVGASGRREVVRGILLEGH